MVEKLVKCQDNGSKIECSSCDLQSRTVPENWSDDVVPVCVEDVRKAVRDGEDHLRQVEIIRKRSRPSIVPRIIIYTGNIRVESGY